MNVSLPPKQFLVEFILEQISAQPIERRILLYRALAAENPQLREQCDILADELEEIERKHRQLFLDFQRRNT